MSSQSRWKLLWTLKGSSRPETLAALGDFCSQLMEEGKTLIFVSFNPKLGDIARFASIGILSRPWALALKAEDQNSLAECLNLVKSTRTWHATRLCILYGESDLPAHFTRFVGILGAFSASTQIQGQITGLQGAIQPVDGEFEVFGDEPPSS